MTARAAARVAPADKTAEADAIVASMLTVGFDRAALRWQPPVARGTPAWAMLALADPSPPARISYRDVDAVPDLDDATFTRSRRFLKSEKPRGGEGGFG